MGGGTLATCIAPQAFSQRINLLRRENTYTPRQWERDGRLDPLNPPHLLETQKAAYKADMLPCIR